jgi:hypothetical protein
VLFCLSSAFMLYGSVSWACQNRSYEALWSLGIMAVGALLSLLDRR